MQNKNAQEKLKQNRHGSNETRKIFVHFSLWRLFCFAHDVIDGWV